MSCHHLDLFLCLECLSVPKASRLPAAQGRWPLPPPSFPQAWLPLVFSLCIPSSRSPFSEGTPLSTDLFPRAQWPHAFPFSTGIQRDPPLLAYCSLAFQATLVRVPTLHHSPIRTPSPSTSDSLLQSGQLRGHSSLLKRLGCLFCTRPQQCVSQDLLRTLFSSHVSPLVTSAKTRCQGLSG